ncbi:uncharacterized protein [Paramormyrops kingsleyae]|uniref:uncharacterized protein n=1 Tax=Paramormyrops kingsleyae TaxID=1676925 RepID=UPI000CD65498|nr:uncharacterized protein LOC111840505 [Paramormyrops kingsleyae]
MLKLERNWTKILLFAGIISGLIPGVLLVYPDSLNIPRGENVTLLCTNIMKNEGFVAWFQQVNQSVPLCILSTYYTTSGDVLDYKYYNGATAERTKMTVTKNNISLRITAVDLYDMGLYFCGMWVEASLFFANATFLHIRGNIPEEDDLHRELPKYDNVGKETSLFPVLVIVGIVAIIQLVVIVILVVRGRLSDRNKDSKGNAIQQIQDEQNQDPHLVNYAALDFTRHKMKAMGRQKDLDTHEVYSATR